MIQLIKKGRKIIVKLEEFNRFIGIIKDRTYRKKIHDGHIMYKYSSIGINCELITQYGHLFDNIEVEYNEKIYRIKTKDVLRFGQVKSEAYFEPQIFVPLNKWEEICLNPISQPTNQNLQLEF